MTKDNEEPWILKNLSPENLDSSNMSFVNTFRFCQAPSTRIRTRLYPQTFCCGFKTLRLYTYSGSLRFRASTRIRENGISTLDLLTEHVPSYMMSKETRLIRKFSLHSSGTTIDKTSPPTICSCRSNPKFSMSCLAPFVRTLNGHISGNWH